MVPKSSPEKILKGSIRTKKLLVHFITDDYPQGLPFAFTGLKIVLSAEFSHCPKTRTLKVLQNITYYSN
jgi:hypothetical protein